MAIVVYNCDTCKREIELPQNTDGLDTLQRCVITHGCRGKLYQVRVHPDYLRGKTPANVSGLNNWIPRRLIYNHTQPIARQTWNIQHNLGTLPTLEVLVDRPLENDPDNTEEIQPEDFRIIDSNNVQLFFERAWSGMAQLVVRQSDPNLLSPIQQEPVVEIPLIPISNEGEITVAVLKQGSGLNDLEPIIDLQLTYNTPVGTIPVLVYNPDDSPSIFSAWRDFDEVVIRGKVYTIYSFNGITTSMTNGDVTSGSTFGFTGVKRDPITTPGSFTTINKSEILILLARPGQTTVDKIVNGFIDVTSDPTPGIYPFIFNNGEFVANPDTLDSTYPFIRSTQ